MVSYTTLAKAAAKLGDLAQVHFWIQQIEASQGQISGRQIAIVLGKIKVDVTIECESRLGSGQGSL